MARPLKDKSAEPLGPIFPLRLTATQKEKLLPEYAKLSGMSQSDYLRYKAFGDPPRQPKATPERAALIKQITNLGFIRADINQILKDRLAHKFVNAKRVDQAFAAIEDLSTLLHQLLEKP